MISTRARLSKNTLRGRLGMCCCIQVHWHWWEWRFFVPIKRGLSGLDSEDIQLNKRRDVEVLKRAPLLFQISWPLSFFFFSECSFQVDDMDGSFLFGNLALRKMIAQTKMPVICVCSDRMDPNIRVLANDCYVIKFARPPTYLDPPPLPRRAASGLNLSRFASSLELAFQEYRKPYFRSCSHE